MKYIITIWTLFVLTTFANAQCRDTLDETKLRSYPGIDVIDLGSTNSVDTRYKDYYEDWFIFIDTISESYFPTYVDSLIALHQQDSIQYQANLEAMFTFYVHWNNHFENTKRLLQKLWAIRP